MERQFKFKQSMIYFQEIVSQRMHSNLLFFNFPKTDDTLSFDQYYMFISKYEFVNKLQSQTMQITLKQPLHSTMSKKLLGSGSFLKSHNSMELKSINTCKQAINANFSKELPISKQLIRKNGKNFLKNKENQIRHADLEVKQAKLHEMRQNNLWLQIQNKQLLAENQKLKQQLIFEREQKTVLHQRIDKFEEDLEQLRKGYQTLQLNEGRNLNINSINPKRITFNVRPQSSRQRRPYQTQQNNQNSPQSQNYLYQILTELKSLKNQLEVEKMRRINIERELALNKENVREEAKMEIELTNKKLQGVKNLLIMKDKEIKEKQSLIERIIRC